MNRSDGRAGAPGEPFAAPRQVDDRADCHFYHTIDLPGEATVRGEWDLRRNVRAYLGGRDWRGRSVLDVGAATGFLIYYIWHSSRGALNPCRC